MFLSCNFHKIKFCSKLLHIYGEASVANGRFFIQLEMYVIISVSIALTFCLV